MYLVRPVVLVLAAFAVHPAVAQAPPPPVGAAHMAYTAYAVGFRVFYLNAAFDLQPSAYRVRVAFRTAGMFGAVVHAENESDVNGGWSGIQATPQRFVSRGVARGAGRLTVIDYLRGQPLVRDLIPPNDVEREPVPPDLQRDTVDTLSAMVMLVRQVAQTGRCDGGVRTFDGRRLGEISVRSAGEVMLEETSRSSYTGPALRCDFEGRQLAGFMHEADDDERRHVQRGAAWIARIVPGVPPLPVRVAFHTRWFGDATMYINSAAAGVGLLSLPR